MVPFSGQCTYLPLHHFESLYGPGRQEKKIPFHFTQQRASYMRPLDQHHVHRARAALGYSHACMYSWGGCFATFRPNSQTDAGLRSVSPRVRRVIRLLNTPTFDNLPVHHSQSISQPYTSFSSTQTQQIHIKFIVSIWLKNLAFIFPYIPRKFSTLYTSSFSLTLFFFITLLPFSNLSSLFARVFFPCVPRDRWLRDIPTTALPLAGDTLLW